MDTHVEILAVVMERRRKLQEIKDLKQIKLVFKLLCSLNDGTSVAMSVMPERTVLYSGVSSEAFPYFQRCFSI